MLATIEAIVEKGQIRLLEETPFYLYSAYRRRRVRQIRLLEETPLPEGTRLFVTILPDTRWRKTTWLTEDENSDEQWREELMTALMKAREEFRASGEPSLDSEGISRLLNRDRFENG